MSAQLSDYSILTIVQSRHEKTITYAVNGLSAAEVAAEIQSRHHSGQLTLHFDQGGNVTKAEWKTFPKSVD